MTNSIPKTHKLVEGFPFNNAEIGDIVIAFGKYQGVVIADFRTDDNPTAPMEVVNIATGRSMMAFPREIKVIAKPWLRAMEIEANWRDAQEKEIQAAMVFDKFDQ